MGSISPEETDYCKVGHGGPLCEVCLNRGEYFSRNDGHSENGSVTSNSNNIPKYFL